MGRMARPVELIDQKKDRKSKAELEQRAEWEEQLSTDMTMQPTLDVKADPEALRTFKRLKKVFSSVQMDDAFYADGLSRYCLMSADASRQQLERAQLADMFERCDDTMERIAIMTAMNKKDSSIAKIRDQMLAWEKENLMTVQAKLRAIPKKPDKGSEEADGIAGFVARRVK